MTTRLHLSYIETLQLCVDTLRQLIADPSLDIEKIADFDTQKLVATGEVDDIEGEMKRVKDKLRLRRSRALDGLAKEFGVTLLEREPQSTSKRPTPEALEVVKRVEILLETHAQVVHNKEPSTVRISAIDAAANFWIPKTIGDCRNDIDIHCSSREWWQVLSDVRLGLADFGIATRVPDESLEQIEILRRPHIAVFSSSNDVLKKKKTIDVEDFEAHGAICLHFFSSPVALEAKLNSMRTRIVRVNNNAQALAWAAEGLGIALLTEDMINSGLKVESKPLSFDAIDAVDCIYRKPDMKPIAREVCDSIERYWLKEATRSPALT